ncbi:MAG: universal stress protein [Flexilinea sp.]
MYKIEDNTDAFGSTSISRAEFEFNRAKRAADWQSAVGIITGKKFNLVDYNDVRSRLSNTSNLPIVQKEIPIKSIVGTVSRNTDFTRTFLPKMAHDKERWVKVKVANESQEGVPPIEVYQIGEVYFVLDGHHRVSVMKSIGAEFISANVRIINTEVPLEPTDSPEDIIVKTERDSFLRNTHIDKLLPDESFELKHPGEYPELLEHIAVHRYFMGLDLKRDITADESVIDWFDHVYMPVIEIVRTREMLQGFPDKTETELYLWIENNKAELTDAFGEEIRTTAVAWNLEDRYAVRKRSLRNKIWRNLFIWLTPNLSDWGVRTGDWRKEILNNDLSPLIKRMMITVNDLDKDKEYLRSGIRFSKKYHAWVGIVHVVKRPTMIQSEWMRKYEEEINRMLDEEGVKGKFFPLSGILLKIVSERAFWSDISLFKLKYRPPVKKMKISESGWGSIISRVPGPIFVVPDKIPENIQNVVLGFSQSPKAREAMYFADALSKSSGCKITVVISGTDEQKRQSAKQEIQSYYARSNVNAEFLICDKTPEKAILETTETINADLIIMGGYTRSLSQRIFKDSTTDKVLTATKIPLIICK